MRGTLSLPVREAWQPGPASRDDPLDDVFLTPVAPRRMEEAGRRVQEAEREGRLKSQLAVRQRELLQVWFALNTYARTRPGKGPASLAELKAASDRLDRVNEDTVFLVPDLELPVKPPPTGSARRYVVAAELKPMIDDGRHWVLYSDGNAERVPLDQGLIEQYKLTITRPKTSLDAPRGEERDEPVPHTVTARLRDLDRPGQILRLRSPITRQALDVPWDWSKAPLGDRKLLTDWANLRARTWQAYLQTTDAPLLRYWLEQSQSLYGTPAFSEGRPGRAEQSTTVFELLGGRAAMRETFQLQALGGRVATGVDPATMRETLQWQAPGGPARRPGPSDSMDPIPLDQVRGVAMNGIGYLEPLARALDLPSVPEALSRHQEIFGFHPVHPAGGEWTWSNRQVVSTTYGSLFQPRQPAYQPGQRDFGALGRVRQLNLSMQLEESGLRASLQWMAR